MRISRDRKHKKQTETLEVKNSITALKNPIESFSSRFNQAEERN